MMTEDEIRSEMDVTREKFEDVKRRHRVSPTPGTYFDKGYWLGRTHALELLLANVKEPVDA